MLSQAADEAFFLALLTIALYQILVSREGLCCLGWVIFLPCEVEPPRWKGNVDEVGHFYSILEEESEGAFGDWDLELMLEVLMEEKEEVL